MKSLVAMLISSFVSLTAVMTLLAFVWPQMFLLMPGIVPVTVLPGSAVQPADSAGVLMDSTHTTHEHGPQALQSEPRKADTSTTTPQKLQSLPAQNERSPAAAQDSIKALVQTVAQLQERFGKRASPIADSLSEAEAKTMAQIFEAMDPASAARILNNMDDRAVKQVLTAMKKRQSAKILAALDPQQAARILKVKGEL